MHKLVFQSPPLLLITMKITFNCKRERIAILSISFLLVCYLICDEVIDATLPSLDVVQLLSKPELPEAVRPIITSNYVELSEHMENSNETSIYVQPTVSFTSFKSTITLQFGVQCLNGLEYQGESPASNYTQKVYSMPRSDPKVQFPEPTMISTETIDKWYPEPFFTAKVRNLASMRALINIVLIVFCLIMFFLALVPSSPFEPFVTTLRVTDAIILFVLRATYFVLFLASSSELTCNWFLSVVLIHSVMPLDVLALVAFSGYISLDRAISDLDEEMQELREKLPPYVSGDNAAAV